MEELLKEPKLWGLGSLTNSLVFSDLQLWLKIDPLIFWKLLVMGPWCLDLTCQFFLRKGESKTFVISPNCNIRCPHFAMSSSCTLKTAGLRPVGSWSNTLPKLYTSASCMSSPDSFASGETYPSDPTELDDGIGSKLFWSRPWVQNPRDVVPSPHPKAHCLVLHLHVL